MLAAADTNPYLILKMTEQTQTDTPLEVSRLEGSRLFIEIVYGIAITVGMALLWALENLRNVIFRALDRANMRPRTRRASAFPPGRPRKLKPPRV
jgi:hypothetical protein